MAGFQEVFNSDEKLKNLSTPEKMGVLDAVYDQMKQMPEVGRGQLRNFRDQQLETMYESMAAQGRTKAPSYEQWQQSMSSTKPGQTTSLGDLMQGIQREDNITEDEKNLFQQYKDRNRKETLNDVAEVLTDNPLHWPVGIAKMGLDLANMVSSAATSYWTQATGIMGKGGHAGEQFSKSLKAFNDTEVMQAISNKHKELTKSDPLMYERLQGLALDGMMGGGIGIARRSGANMAISSMNKFMKGAAEAAGTTPELLAPLTFLESAKIVSAPVASNVLSGQLIWEGMERTGKWLDAKGVDESTKAGITAFAMIGGALVGGAAIEGLVNKVVRGETALQARLAQMGDWLNQPQPLPQRTSPIQQVEQQQGIAGQNLDGNQVAQQQTSLGDLIRANPEKFSDDFMSLAREAELELGPNFDPLKLADDLDATQVAEGRLRAGEELSVEEAELLQARGAGMRKAYPFSEEELREIVPPMRSSLEEDIAYGQRYDEASVAKQAKAAEDGRWLQELDESAKAPELELVSEPVVERPVAEVPMTQKQGVTRGLETAKELERMGNVEDAGRLRAALAENVLSENGKVVPKKENPNFPSPDTSIEDLRKIYRDTNEQLKFLRKVWKNAETPEARIEIERDAASLKNILADVEKRGKELAQQKKEPQVKFRERPVQPITSKNRKEAQAQLRKLRQDLRAHVNTPEGKAELAKKDELARRAYRGEVQVRGLLEEQLGLTEPTGSERAEILKKLEDQNRWIENVGDWGKELVGQKPVDKWSTNAPEYMYGIAVDSWKREKNVLERMKERQAKSADILAEKRQVRAERGDVQTLMEELTPTQRMDIEILTDGLVKGREYSLKRALTEEERLDMMAAVYNQKQLWDGNIYDASDSLLVENTGTGKIGVSAGYIEAKYPQLARLLSLNEPSAMTSQVFSPGNILGTMSSLISRSGSATDVVGWQKVKPIIREVAEAWDEVKAELLEADTGLVGLRASLAERAKEFYLNPEQAKEVADAITFSFPELDVALKFDDGTLGSAQGIADSLLRAITIGTDGEALRTLSHELGHIHFNYGLSADEKIAYLDEMRRVAGNDELWKRMMPGYEQKLEGMKQRYLDEFNAGQADLAMKNLQDADFALHSPLELYAEQWSDFMFNSVLPSANTLKSFGRLQKGYKELVKEGSKRFNQMNDTTKEFFLKTLSRPDVSEAKVVPRAEIQASLERNPFYSSDPLLAADRINEIDRLMDEKYGQSVVDPTTLDVQTVQSFNLAGGADAIGGEEILSAPVPFQSLPLEVRINRVSPEDALLLVERDALSLLHQGDDAGTLAEMQAAMEKVELYLNPATREDLIARLVEQRTAIEQSNIMGSGDKAVLMDPSIMNNRTVADRMNERLDDYNIAETQELRAYNRMSKEDQREVNKAKWAAAKKYYAKRAQVIKNMIDAGQKDMVAMFGGLSGKKLDAAIDKFLKEGKTYKQRSRTAFLEEQKEAGVELTPTSVEEFRANEALIRELDALQEEEWQMVARGGMWPSKEAAKSSVIHELAAMDLQADLIGQLMNGAKAKLGYMDAIDGGFSTKMYQADQFAAAWARQASSGLDAGGLLSLGARMGYVGLAGLEYDPDGLYVPGLGTVTWSPRKFLENPFNIAMVPGFGKVASKLSKLGGKFAGATWKQVLDHLPPRMAQQVNDLWIDTKSAIAAVAHPTGGIGDDVADMLSQGKMAAAKAQSDFRGFAELLLENFSAKDRERIWKVLDHHSRWEQLEQAIAKQRPDLYVTIQLTRGIMDKMRQQYIDLGLVSDKMPHSSQGNWIAPYVDDTLSKARGSRIAVLERSNIQGISANYLGANKIGWTLGNGKKYGTAGANKLFREACARDGITPQVGDKVNEYRELRRNGQLEGKRYYAIDGSPTDLNFRKVYEKEHCWTEHREGYTISEVPENSGSIKLERNFTVKEKRMAGQSFDVATNFAHTASRMGKDLTNAHIYSLVHDSDRCIAQDKFSNNPDGAPGADPGAKADYAVAENNAKLFNQYWAFVPEKIDKKTGILKYGKLTGTYIDRDVWEALRWKDGMGVSDWLMNSRAAPLVVAHRWLLRNWKMNKTVLSPVAHMNNFVSNLFAGTMMGHNVVDELKIGSQCIRFRMKELEARNLRKQGKSQEAADIYAELQRNPLYAEYTDVKNAQMADSTMWANEMKASEFYDLFIQELEGAGKKEKGVLGKVGEKLGKVRDKAANVYEAGDLMFKMGAFIAARREGKTASEALRYAYESYFDYGTLSPGARMLRDTGIFPFVSYAYKAFPAVLKGMKEHPGTFAATLTGLEVFQLTNINMAYGDGEAIKHREELGKVLPNYMGGKGLFGMATTRPFIGLDDKGNPQVLDMSRMMFGGDFGETSAGGAFSDMANFEKWAPSHMLGTLVNQSPAMAYLTEKMTGVNPTMGTPTIRGGTALDDPNVRERRSDAEWYKLWNIWAPNWPGLPYTYASSAIVDGLKGQGLVAPGWLGKGTGLNRYGEPKPLGSALASAFGIKVRTKDLRSVEAELKMNVGEVNKEKAELNKKLKSQEWTTEEKLAVAQKFQETSERQAKKRFDKASAMANLLKAANAKKRETGGTALPGAR